MSRCGRCCCEAATLWRSIGPAAVTDLVGLVSVMAMLLAIAGVAYLWLLVAAAARGTAAIPLSGRATRFAVLVPAHNEAETIGDTVRAIHAVDYPSDRYEVFVVADHCSDATADRAREAGAIVFERRTGFSGSKGAALSWLIDEAAASIAPLDALVICDADTRMDGDFLRIMDAHLATGSKVVQGRHAIYNGSDGVYPALAEAMLRIENRVGNQGRANLGASAKDMGDSICFGAAILREYALDRGLTEDYALRQKLLLAGIRIDYAHGAVGYGEAPTTWARARSQRARWLHGTLEASRHSALALLRAGIRRRDRALLDGAAQAMLPAYSSLVVMAAAGVVAEAVLLDLQRPLVAGSWLATGVLLFAYPWTALILDRAPARSFAALLAGPLFVLWRSVLAVTARLPGRRVLWVRTERRTQ